MAPAPTAPKRTGIVLAGGRSSRIGRPKALLEIGGEPLIARVVRRLGAICDEVVIVAAPRGSRPAGELESLERAVERALAGVATGAGAARSVDEASGARPPAGTALRMVHDGQLDRGPVAGLAAGLAAARAPYAFVSACDAPFLATALVRGLFAIAEASPETDLVIARTSGGLEPMVAIYRVATMAPLYAEQLAAGDLRPTSRLGPRKVREVAGEELAALDPSLESFVGVNDESEYSAALDRERRRGRAAGGS